MDELKLIYKINYKVFTGTRNCFYAVLIETG